MRFVLVGSCADWYIQLRHAGRCTWPGKLRRKSREGSRWQAELGDYFIVSNNTVTAGHVQLDKLARKLGCMAAFERLED